MVNCCVSDFGSLSMNVIYYMEAQNRFLVQAAKCQVFAL
jgi:hypothetical protein